jgi:hypothetical protein
MDTDLLTRKFEALGARLKVTPVVPGFRMIPVPITLDIREDRHGEFFDLKIDRRQLENVDAVDVRSQERHLLLMAWVRPGQLAAVPDRHASRRERLAWVPELVPGDELEKPRFLCGHDERHWFVAAVPEEAHASNVRTAMEALKPAEVRNAQSRGRVSFAKRFRRKNSAFVRQGEWFFLPRPNAVVPQTMIRRHEPLQRSGGKAHWAEFAFRSGGEAVYVSSQFPQGLTETQYQRHISRRPQDRGLFQAMVRNATLLVHGRVSHPDHATIVLHGWHEVVMNTEHRAKARANVVFLD